MVTETTVVPFLPVNPEYSSTRNQGRQKLARFNAHEFATLVIDILSDAKRRQQGSPLSSAKDNVELILKTISNQHSTESQDNDQPDYDSVASDEDTDVDTAASRANRQKLQTLQSENSNLRKQATTNTCQVQTGSEYPDTSNHSSLKRRPSARGSRPMSMYETGSGQNPYLPMGEASHPEESRTRLQPFPAHVSNPIGASALRSVQPQPDCSVSPSEPVDPHASALAN